MILWSSNITLDVSASTERLCTRVNVNRFLKKLP